MSNLTGIILDFMDFWLLGTECWDKTFYYNIIEYYSITTKISSSRLVATNFIMHNNFFYIFVFLGVYL